MKTGSIDGIGLNLPVCVTTVHDKFALNNKTMAGSIQKFVGSFNEGLGKTGLRTDGGVIG